MQFFNIKKVLIMKDELHIKQQKHYPYVTKVNKKVNDRAATNNSIQFINRRRGC